MEDLTEAMQLIDKHVDKLPEGDYIKICNHLKKAYNKRNDPTYLFNYENFSVPPIGEHELEIRYFYDYYFDKALNLESDYIEGQIDYLKRELSYYQPIRRISKSVREDVELHYLYIYGTEIDPQVKKKEFDTLCRSFIQIENNFREKYRNEVLKKIECLEDHDENLNNI